MIDRIAARLGRIDTRDLVAWGTLFVLLANTPRSPAALPALLLVIVATAPWWRSPPMSARLRRGPLLWLLVAGGWAPFLLQEWWRHEDHEFLGLEHCLLLGLAFAGSRPRTVLRQGARWLVVAIFACALAWKLTAPSFLRGETFLWAIEHDARFARIAALLGPARAPYLAAFMTVWTLLTEGSIVAAFAAPEASRLARLREPALALFVASVYTLIPILGFGGLFLVLGLATTRSPRWRALFVLLGAWLALRLALELALRLALGGGALP